MTSGLIFPQNSKNNSHFGMGRIDLVRGFGLGWGLGVGALGMGHVAGTPPTSKQRVALTLQKILSAPKGRGGNNIFVLGNRHFFGVFYFVFP